MIWTGCNIEGNQRYSWTKNNRSPFVSRTLPWHLRCSTIACCRSAAFSPWSRTFDLNGDARMARTNQRSPITRSAYPIRSRAMGRGFRYRQGFHVLKWLLLAGAAGRLQSMPPRRHALSYGPLRLFLPSRSVRDVPQFSGNVRLINKVLSFAEAIGNQHGFDHLRTMAMARQLTRHFHHLGDAVFPTHAPAHAVQAVNPWGPKGF